MKLLFPLYAALLGFASVLPSQSQNSSSTSSLRKHDPEKERQLLLFDLWKLWPTPPTHPIYSPTQPIFSPVQPIFRYPAPAPVHVPVPVPVPAPPPALKCASLPTGQFYNIIAKHSNMAVNVEGAFLTNGASLIQWPVSQANNDNWRFESVGSGYYQIIAEHSGKAMNVLGGGKGNGNTVVQWDAPQGVEDDWCFVDRGSGFYAIYNRGSGKVLAVPSSSLQAGAKLVQWDFLNIADQLWKLVPVVVTPRTPPLVCATISIDRFHILAKHSNMAIRVDQGLTSNGASLIQWPVDQGTTDNWRLQSVGSGYYQIISEFSHKGINVLGAGKDNGNQVVQWEVPQREEDDWCFVDRGSGYYSIHNRNSGRVIAVPGKSMQAGTKLVQWAFSNSVDQLWKLAPVVVTDECLNRFGPAPTHSTCEFCARMGIDGHLNNKDTDLLNTAVDNETPAMIATRLEGDVPMEDPENMKPLYNPVYDAFCFNEDYPVPSLNTHQQISMYYDYKVEFDRVLAFTTDVSEENNRVTNNRIPGMFLRMCFHDNAVDLSQPDFQDYITRSFDPRTRKWNGEAKFLNTSGADASHLICPQERYHPNNNYDQTATRVLNSIQRTLKGKYKHMSYADLLHNGCNAATIYLTGGDIKSSLTKNPFTFGRKDACRADNKCKKRYPLCGPTELLPGLALSVTGVNDWFRLRGMSECLFMALMWTHTTMDNMGSLCPIKKLTCTANSFDVAAFTNRNKLYFRAGDNLDYFNFFLKRGTHFTLPDTGDDGDPNCNWNVDGRQVPWPMTGIDCTLGLGNVQKAGVAALSNAIVNLGHNTNGLYNKVDILQCALKVLGGRGGVEGGSCNLILPTECKSQENHKFGGFYSNLPTSNVQRITIDPKCEIVGF